MSYAGFLDLPVRSVKPRTTGITHVLDKGLPVKLMEQMLEQSGALVDILKVGWGIAYIDSAAKDRIALCHDHGIAVSLGGTLLEIAVAQGRMVELCRWAEDLGISVLEVSNGLQRIDRHEKARLVRDLSGSFVVVAEAGVKDDRVRVDTDEWISEMTGDLDAGAAWVIAEGRESGTVGLYHPDGSVRGDLVNAIERDVRIDRVIFEAPRKSQQVWFLRRFGSDVSLGNIVPEEVLPLETLRLGLRADTAASILPATR